MNRETRRLLAEGFRVDSRGRLLLTANEVCLLLALRDFEDGSAPTRRAWTDAAARYLGHVRPGASWRNLLLSSWAMPDALVAQWRDGRGIRAQLRRLGERVLAREVPVAIVRYGPWRGFDALVREADSRRARRAEVLARRARRGHGHEAAFARGDLWGGPRDGSSVVVQVPLADDLMVTGRLADGTRCLARYVRDDARRPEVVRVRLERPWTRLDPLPDEVRARLDATAGVRYRFAGPT